MKSPTSTLLPGPSCEPFFSPASSLPHSNRRRTATPDLVRRLPGSPKWQAAHRHRRLSYRTERKSFEGNVQPVTPEGGDSTRVGACKSAALTTLSSAPLKRSSKHLFAPSKHTKRKCLDTLPSSTGSIAAASQSDSSVVTPTRGKVSLRLPKSAPHHRKTLDLFDAKNIPLTSASDSSWILKHIAIPKIDKIPKCDKRHSQTPKPFKTSSEKSSTTAEKSSGVPLLSYLLSHKLPVSSSGNMGTCRSRSTSTSCFQTNTAEVAFGLNSNFFCAKSEKKQSGATEFDNPQSATSMTCSKKRRLSDVFMHRMESGNTVQVRQLKEVSKPCFSAKTLWERFSVCGTLADCNQSDYDDKLLEVTYFDERQLQLLHDNDDSATTKVNSLFNKSGIGSVCKKGLKPDAPNQDNFFVIRDENVALYGVFDGHGPCGHDVSNYVTRQLPKVIMKDEDYLTDIKETLRRSFIEINSMLKDAAHNGNQFDVSLSGCTATVAVVQVLPGSKMAKLIMAHVGDSRAVIARRPVDECGEVAASAITTIELTVDHKPNTQQEFARIISAGGQVKRVEGDIPHRVFVKGQLYPGLAMSRALGDVIVSRIGVTCEPDVSEFEVSPDQDYFMLICSDGVWEFMSSDEAVLFVTGRLEENSSPQKAAEALAQESRQRWIKEEGTVVDDITVQVIMIDSHFTK